MVPELGAQMKTSYLLILLSLFSSTAFADSLTLYAYPPKNDLKWTSPRSTLYTFLGGELGKLILVGDNITSIDEWGEESTIREYYKSSMGHTIAHIKCTSSDNKAHDSWVSFSGQNFLEVDKKNILKEHMGLGVLFYDYIDGHIISGEDNIKRLVYYKGGRREGKKVSPRYMQYKIGTKACDDIMKMTDFFKSFHFKAGTTLEELQKLPDEKKLYFTTTMEPYETYLERMNNPKSKVGGGCAPFAVGLLKAAGLFEQYFDDNWRLNVQVSEKLMGNKENPVTLKDLLLNKTSKTWTHEGYNNRLMSVYDPNLIWTFIGKVNECLKTNKKNCAPEYLPWVLNHENALKSGAPVTFSDTRKVGVQTMKGDETVYETIEKTKTVKIEGIILE